MMRLDADMQRVVREQSLGFVATVCPDGTANVSPKGTLTVWDDQHLVFLHVHSPGTVANLAANPSVEINVVDPLVRTGYRFKGTAEVLTDGARFAAVVDRYARERGTDPTRVRAVVLVRVEAAAALVSPAYDTGASEASIVRRWRAHHLDLAASRLGEEPPPPT
jgi:predicted pyridoxine 5'-phosphate oxidase superfamily flavin-nucleotide-binding protein